MFRRTWLGATALGLTIGCGPINIQMPANSVSIQPPTSQTSSLMPANQMTPQNPPPPAVMGGGVDSPARSNPAGVFGDTLLRR